MDRTALAELECAECRTRKAHGLVDSMTVYAPKSALSRGCIILMPQTGEEYPLCGHKTPDGRACPSVLEFVKLAVQGDPVACKAAGSWTSAVIVFREENLSPWRLRHPPRNALPSA
jgi:hypothetical protein